MGSRSQTPRDTLQTGQTRFRRELARDYTDTAKRLVSAYRGTLNGVAQYLDDLERKAGGVDSTSELLGTAEFRSLQGALKEGIDDFADIIGTEAASLERKALAKVPGMVESQLKAVGIADFNRPSAQSIQSLASLVDSAPFQKRLEDMGSYYSNQIRDTILTDASLGKSPYFTARHIRRVASQMPMVDALRMTRTSQVIAARRGTQAIYQQNREIVLGWRWGSALDARCCVSCIAQHGKSFPVDQVLNDHHNGRCAMIPITRYNLDEPVQTGQEWLETQPESTQKQILGKAGWELWKKKDIILDDFVGERDDPVYGTMRYARSLKSIPRDRSGNVVRETRPEDFFIPGKPSDHAIGWARAITPDRLENGDYPEAAKPVADALWNVFTYDANANGQWSREKIDEQHNELLYDIWKLGRAQPSPKDIENARIRASVILSTHEQAGYNLGRAQRNQLNRLALGSDSDVEAEMFKVKDNRRVGRVTVTGGGSGRRGSRFIGANEADGIARLRENNTPWWEL